MSETYISVDVEADGPIPGVYSMLSIGAVAYDNDGSYLGEFSVNIKQIPGASQDPSTMEFWKGNKAAYEATKVNAVEPLEAMVKFDEWVAQYNKPVFVAYPAGFDFTFTHWYFIRYLGRDPFGFSALDLKSFAMAVLATDYRATTKKNMPRSWFIRSNKHSHIAVEDAREQGELFFKMRAESYLLEKVEHDE